VDGVNVATGKYLIIHTLFFDLNDETTTIPTSTGHTGVTEAGTDVSDAREYNINYDPIIPRTSIDGGTNDIKDKDL